MTEHERDALDRPIPPEVADNLQTAFGLDARPATLADWTRRTASRLDAIDWTFTPADLCRAESGSVRVTIDGETMTYRCIFDAFLLPHLTDVGMPLQVAAETPVHATTVSVRLGSEAVSTDPASAVMSLGTTAAVLPPQDDTSLDLAYASFCPYINPFEDVAEYERWAASTPEARTMQVPLTAGVALAGALLDPSDEDGVSHHG